MLSTADGACSPALNVSACSRGCRWQLLQIAAVGTCKSDAVGLVLTGRLVADTEEGPMAVSAGNIVSLATKPVQYGRILHFGIDKVRDMPVIRPGLECRRCGAWAFL